MRKQKIYLGLLGVIITAATVGGPLVVYSAPGNPINNNPDTQYTLLEPLPCVPSPAQKDASGQEIPNSAVTCNGQQQTSLSFRNYVQYAFNLLIALAAVAAVFMIVWGGFEYMSSDSFNKKSDGLKKLQNAIYGLLLVLCSYLILRTVDPRLVNIPTTLVAPLNINYKPNEVTSFFKQLQDDANRYRAENMQIINNVASAQKEYERLGAEKEALCAQLAAKLQIPYSGSACDVVKGQYGPYQDEETQKLANQLGAQIASIDSQQASLSAKMAGDVAIGKMNAVIQKCYGVTSSNTRYWLFFNAQTGAYEQKDCIEEINTAAAKGANQLQQLGQNDAANKILNYQKYAASMANINTIVKRNMSSSPDVTAFVDTLQSAVTAGATAAGAVYAGPLGAVGGFAGAQIINASLIGAPSAAANSSAAKETVAQIQLEINNTAESISDPNIQAMYKAQAYALIVKLGGKGNGQDAPATPGSAYQNPVMSGSSNFQPAPKP